MRFDEEYEGTIGVRDYRKPHGQRPERIQVYGVGAPISDDGNYGKFFAVACFDMPEEQERVKQILGEKGYEDMDKIVF